MIITWNLKKILPLKNLIKMKPHIKQLIGMWRLIFFINAEDAPSFTSNNKLHNHLRSNCNAQNNFRKDPSIRNTVNCDEIDLEILTPKPSSTVLMNGLGFRRWHYTTITFRSSPKGSDLSGCPDSGCTMTLIDSSFLYKFSRHKS